MTDLRVSSIDDSGITFRAGADAPIDVLVDGRRVWSFWSLRDSQENGEDRHVGWPGQLRRFLNGTARLTLTEHVTGTVRHDGEVTLGSGEGRIAVVDGAGNPLGLDKSNRISKTFDTRSGENVESLLNGVELVLDALTEAGVAAFPAYGTLLGAVRGGRLIGHDSDADLGYVSRHESPADVIRESFDLQRALRGKGYRIHRYSGGGFRVDVPEGDGQVRGLDVFTGFMTGGRLYLMGEVGAPFQEDWIFPLGTCELEGRTLPAPARPEKLLEAMYGPGWKVPDPAFKFETSPDTIRRLSGWFRGTGTFRADWDRVYSGKAGQLPAIRPSALASFVVEREGGVPPQVLDVGCGRCADALWFARNGARVVGLDFVKNASRAAQVTAQREERDLDVRWCNLQEIRSTLSTGAALAVEGPWTIVANHVVDATTARGRDGLARLARLALASGGTLYADFAARTDAPPRRGKDLLTPVDVRAFAEVLTTHGARIVHDELIPAPADQPDRPTARLVAQWGTRQ